MSCTDFCDLSIDVILSLMDFSNETFIDFTTTCVSLVFQCRKMLISIRVANI